MVGGWVTAADSLAQRQPTVTANLWQSSHPGVHPAPACSWQDLQDQASIPAAPVPDILSGAAIGVSTPEPATADMFRTMTRLQVVEAGTFMTALALGNINTAFPEGLVNAEAFGVGRYNAQDIRTNLTNIRIIIRAILDGRLPSDPDPMNVADGVLPGAGFQS
jgi:hypothetical protein